MTNEDRKLLELAAKVHGYIDDAATPDTEERQHGLHKGVDGCFYVVNQHGWTTWNPRTDDGDSRMLQVACRIALHFEVIGGEWCAEAYSQEDENGDAHCTIERLQDDANKAARMAILRCAGMIGEAME